MQTPRKTNYMSYTGWCEEAQDNCPGGPEDCLLSVNPTDPEICFALEGGGGGDDEIDPPGGPGG